MKTLRLLICFLPLLIDNEFSKLLSKLYSKLLPPDIIRIQLVTLELINNQQKNC
jgi:hypothetical protein